MGAATGALIAMTAVTAASQIGQGYAQQAEAKFNASLLEGQAGLIQIQKDIENAQYQRMKGKVWSTSMAQVAGAGLKPTGSAAAVMIDTQTQIGIDQAIGQFNFEMQKQYKMSEADAMRRKGKMAVQAGWTNAFTTVLQGGYQASTRMGQPKLGPSSTPQTTTTQRGSTIYRSQTAY